MESSILAWGMHLLEQERKQQTRIERTLRLLDRNEGYWTRGNRVYKARKSGVIGVYLLEDLYDPFNVIEVKLSTLANRWKHLKEIP